MQLLYAIRHARTELPALPLLGPDGEAVQLLREGRLAAVCAPCQPAPTSVTGLMAYAEVIDSLFGQGDLLPLRHGCWLEEADVRDLLRNRQKEFLASLAGLTDCLEMGVRLIPASTPPPAPPSTPNLSGTAYLVARWAQFAIDDARKQLACRLKAAFQEVFGSVIQRLDVEAPRSEGEPFALHLLLQRGQRSRFEEAFVRWQKRRPERMILTGPWPPYHFASVKLASREN